MMAQYVLQTNERRVSGYVDVLRTKMDVFTPYNFFADPNTGFFQSGAPFSLLFTKYSHEEDIPFSVRMISPDFLMEASLTQEEFEHLVLTRPLHRHDTYELMYIIDGELWQKIENSRHKYIKDSCCLINRNVRHAEEYVSDFHSVNISLSKEYFAEMIREGDETVFAKEKVFPETDITAFIGSELHNEARAAKQFIDFIPQPDLYETEYTIRDFLDMIVRRIETPYYGSSIMIKAYLYNMFAFLNNKAFYRTEPMHIGTAAEDELFGRISLLMEQTNGRISRSELADQLNYSGSYINQVVRKYTGMSIFDYGTSIAMQRAAHLLRSEKISVSEIIQELGFSDRTHFYRLFKEEYGMTPKEYRKAGRTAE